MRESAMTEEISFLQTDAKEIYNDVIIGLMDFVNEPLYPGDERRIFGEALAYVLTAVYNDLNDAAKQKMLRYARGNILDALGERVNTMRALPAAASDTFRFSVSEPNHNNIIIPVGTRITPDGSVYFATKKVAVLQSGDLYVDVEAECMTAGSDYNNLVAGSIGTLVDLIPYISDVTNLNGTSGGDNGEPYTTEGDNHYRERIRLAPAAFSVAGPESAYSYFALSAAPEISDVYIENPEGNYINIYALMANGEIPSEEVLQKIEAKLSADDVRPMCDVVSVFAPSQVEYDIEIKYYCTIDHESDAVTLVETAGGAIEQYNAWQVKALGRDINPDQLRRYVLSSVKGEIPVLRVDIIHPTFTILTKKEIAKFSGNLSVTHEIVEE